VTTSDEFFDAAFLDELEELASTGPSTPRETAWALAAQLDWFRRPASPGEPPLTEDAFAQLGSAALSERTALLVDICREAGGTAARAVESFIIFFQALVPTLTPDAEPQIRRVFFRLVPSLIQIASAGGGSRAEASEALSALHNLEAILIEISSIRLAPTERDLVSRSIDHLAGFIAAADYTLANQVISEQLLGLIRRNKLARALYRIMEVEVSVQQYLKERLGYTTPEIHLPEDVTRLNDYGPIRIFEEVVAMGRPRRFLQFQIPDIPILRDIVLHLVSKETGHSYDFRLDALGGALLVGVPDGSYSLGLAYEPA
jgi:hypothetical protein